MNFRPVGGWREPGWDNAGSERFGQKAGTAIREISKPKNRPGTKQAGKKLYSSPRKRVLSGMSPLRHLMPTLLQPFSFAIELWRNRALLKRFTLRNVELRHKGSHLGLAWSVLNPLLMLSLYVFIFGYIFNGSFRVLPNETKWDYALTIFLGLTLFQFLSEVVSVAPFAIVANPNLVKKVVFPTLVLPASIVGAAGVHFLISLALALFGIGLLGPGLTLRALWMPVLLLPMLPLALGFAWFLAAIGVFLRDINQVIGFSTMVLMYASALFFPKDIIPPAAWAVLRFNPLLLAVELVRDAVIWNRPLPFHYLLYLYVFSLIACILGYICFRKLSPAFADVL